MKKQQIIAIFLILLLTAFSFYNSIRFYTSIYERSEGLRYISMPPIQIVQQVIYLFMNILIVTLCGIFLLSPSNERKDKAYRYIRFITIVNFFLYLPVQLINLYNTVQYIKDSLFTYLLWFVVFNAVEVVIVVLLLKNKPGKNIQRVNLEEYELVAYTSGAHRFVHYLLDMLFLFPVLLSFMSMAEYVFGFNFNPYLMQLIILFIYLVYCFVSELVFKQTLGKMITNSCVVSSGTPLSPGRVFIRTLCRLIPFDGISFLFRANWHDNISSTSVVYVDTWQKVFIADNTD